MSFLHRFRAFRVHQKGLRLSARSCAFVWMIRVFSHYLLQSSLCGLDTGSLTSQDVSDADGKERPGDWTHDVYPIVGEVPEHKVRAERTGRIHRCPADGT